MTPLALVAFAALVGVTSILSGVFGIAGGMILMGGLLMLMPVADAMVLHGVTQAFSNGWRAVLWRKFVDWRIFWRFLTGLLASAGIFLVIHVVPDQRVVFVILGILPFISVVLPTRWFPHAGQRFGAELAGFICAAFQLTAGVSGPTIDMFFVRTEMGRREIVATKAVCQVVAHLTKLAYFGSLIAANGGTRFGWHVVALAIVFAVAGNSVGRMILQRLTDDSFRRYTRRIIMAVGAVYLVRGIIG